MNTIQSEDIFTPSTIPNLIAVNISLLLLLLFL